MKKFDEYNLLIITVQPPRNGPNGLSCVEKLGKRMEEEKEKEEEQQRLFYLVPLWKK